MNLNQFFGLSLSEIDDMDYVERKYWVYMMECIKRRKKIEDEIRRMSRKF